MTFLHPRPGDDGHIILLLVLVKHRRSRTTSTTVIYEWELGDDLNQVFAEEKQGHRMPVEFQMPLMLIPLTIKSAFLAVSADRIALCTECLHGPPVFETIELAASPPTRNHRGRGAPLWAAWARPFRLWSYNKTRDCVYLAREDGVVLLLEADQDGALASHALDPFPCNIANTFACIFDHSTDVLVLGSHSGPGGCWKLPPRQPAELLGYISNWAPVVDFTTTDDFTGWHPSDHPGKVMIPWQEAKLRRPDRIFATCEGGRAGSITEYRYGLKANIGLDLEYGPEMKRAWLIPYIDPPYVVGYLLLISKPDSTAALLLSGDFSGATVPGPGTIPFDLSSSTLILVSHNQVTIQVTQEAVVLANHHGSILLRYQSLPGLLDRHLVDACVLEDVVALSTSAGTRFQIHLFKADLENLSLTHVRTVDVDGDVTCLALGANHTVFAGIWTGSHAYMAWGSLQEPVDGLRMLDLSNYVSDDDASLGLDQAPLVEGIESIISVGDTVFLGTRAGKMITVKHTADPISIQDEKFGTTPVTVSCSQRPGATHATILVCCDNSLVSVRLRQLASHYSGGGGGDLKTNFRVWPVDASKPGAGVPLIQYATVVETPCKAGITTVLMISGSRLLLAEMHGEPGPVHRSIPVKGGMPNRVIYCHFLQCLVVAVDSRKGPDLMFINPDTGEGIGKPTDQRGVMQFYIAGLGKQEDRITALTEWNYRRDKSVWNFIIVTTMGGQLIVVTTEKLPPQNGGPTTFRYWTRFKKDVKESIYAVVGYDEGLIYSTRHAIHWEVIDHQEKKLRPLKSQPLSSTATRLRISNGKLHALTHQDSLLIFDNTDAGTANAQACFADPWRRSAFDCIELAGSPAPTPPQSQTDAEASSSTAATTTTDYDITDGIHLISDRGRGVAALWVPWKSNDKVCEMILQAELPSSIRRFCRGRTRPVWDQLSGRPRFGRLPATVDDAEILGVALDGSLYRFTLLSIEAWRLLRFVQNLAVTKPFVCPFGASVARMRGLDDGAEDPDWGSEPTPAGGGEMQVDGDILQRCLERRVLELLVGKDEYERLARLLRALDGGRHTEGFAEKGDYAKYFRLAYEVLEYYLSLGI
ncbi:mono-functional DNA-alkylating methyl methanesulfonate N-term-domain-containing protein [Chaetomium tenue]|uniref:Mono-functional DNA-alkylating methyl methanesulfonate N-term-domain-containing protein n=1 Tax=Chaetomium tenue TaxID=1854479 RepID=A0ACB7P6D2_9PEZI|nr:mono-functional DNA-alkylating methyl methanesulfonate N-term-domain-containing protein [Chaetomium globosum]